MEDKLKPANFLYPENHPSNYAETVHGVKVSDPFRWLEDIDSQDTQQWIRAQNLITSDYLGKIPAREYFHKRITKLWDYEKYGVPFKRGNRYFFTYNDGLQNQNSLYWMESLQDEPKLLLDPNSLSSDGTIALTGLAVSPDGVLVAYGLSKAGSDWMEWYVREVGSTQDLVDHLQWVKFSTVSWDKFHQGFFYSRYETPIEGTSLRGQNFYHKLFFHQLGTLQTDDLLIYERPGHKEWGFNGQVTDDGRYLVISVWLGTYQQNGAFCKDLHQNDSSIVELLNKFDASYEFISNIGSTLYFRTDLDAPLLRVIGVNINNPEPKNWIEIIPESIDTLQSVSLVYNHFIATYLHNAHSLVKIYDLQGNPLKDIDLPGLGTAVGFIGEIDEPETFYLFTSFNTPGSIFHYDVASGKSILFRQPETRFDPELFITKQIFYTSLDGTRIPMFICHKKEPEINGDNPTYLSGYGGFNISLTPTFSVSNLVWMEKGGVFCQANLRGGGEFGKSWHEAGVKINKQNVFDDFISAAEWLIQNKITNPHKLAIGGRSNGGLLVGACMTQRPDLFGACYIGVGVLDMLRFHKFTIGWAWVSDYGSPENLEEFQILYKYSPYHNLKPNISYPPTLITTADHDDRVYPAHSFKFTAALQHFLKSNKTDKSGPGLIRIETKAGHGLGKPTTKVIEENAEILGFISYHLGLEI